MTTIELPAADVVTFDSREAWLEARQAGLGSSDAAAVLNVSPWHTAYTLFHEKVGFRSAPLAKQEAAEWGTLLEPLLATRYEKATGRELTYPGPYTLVRHREHPYLFASLDRLVLDPEKGLGALELKTAASYKVGEWLEEPPLAYQVQVQHQLAVTGLPWASIAVLIGGQRFTWLDVPRHEPFIAELIQRETAFWQRVLAFEPPAVDGSDETKALLSALYPKDEPGLTVALPPEALEWDRARLEACDQLTYWDSIKTEAENKLKAAIGPASVGLVDGAVSYTWKASTRKGYTVAPSTVRTLRRVVSHA